MPFCPNCETEYKGNVSVCPECGEHLIEMTEDEDLEESVDADEAELFLLYRSPSPEISEELTDALRDAGITFEFRPVENSARSVKSLYRGQNVDGEFYVGEDDLDVAKEIAESIIGDLDEDIV
ncbi:MAG: hypothetical protein IT585_06325 [candidate division Zixibacteria bacterium]|nr:hypothetical protein [candidate division Zixibacteria bacterium]